MFAMEMIVRNIITYLFRRKLAIYPFVFWTTITQSNDFNKAHISRYPHLNFRPGG